MKDVLKTADPVKLSFAQSVLRDAGIESFVLDEGMTSIYPGGIEFVTNRLSVADDDEVEALQVLADAFSETE